MLALDERRHPANWHPDPMGRHQLRYWDGTAWTDHVSDNGVQASDPLQPRGLDRVDQRADRRQRGRRRRRSSSSCTVRASTAAPTSARPRSSGGGTIFTEPILVVNQKAKMIELNNQYGVFNQSGQQIAAVNQVGQSAAKKVLRLVSSLDQFMTHKLEITDSAGAVLLRLTRPAKVMKSTVIVSDGRRSGDRPDRAGQHVRQDPLQRCRPAATPTARSRPRTGGRGTSASRTTPAPRSPASPRPSRVSPRRCSPPPTTTSCRSTPRLPQPLNSLVVAAALSVDTALKQDSRAASADDHRRGRGFPSR